MIVLANHMTNLTTLATLVQMSVHECANNVTYKNHQFSAIVCTEDSKCF